MKYIRTKDDVYCFEKNFILKQNKKGEVIITKPNRHGYSIFNIKDIIKQADTIEELCDEFVVCMFGNPRTRTITRNLLEIQHFIANQKLIGNDKNVVVYGAIWTEWGLKYVAKMNEKGCLELL